ncbi:MAG: SH3 domain-containing protein [Lachnospiraceae bacterium]|nr:SH3 domain-containing protein [Lachnospiraceae bacterium]MDD6505093.1 SH3 domain-containing protein [Lachnospiraceae bacterium]
MKKRILTIVLVSVLAMATLAGCGKSEIKSVENEAAETTHEHTYTEEITKEATCFEEGEKTFTCECGNTYTEAIPVTDHDFTEYVSNEDATYEADGTETATCSVCGETDTRVAKGSMLTYTFEDMEVTKYAKSTVNVRSLPIADGDKLGGLSQNDEVKVTGKCNETGWYRIEYSGNVAYVSDSYLVDNKVETKPVETTSNSGSTASASSEFPYELYKVYYNDSLAWFYSDGSAGYSDTFWNAYNEAWAYNRARYTVVDGKCPEFDAALAADGASWYNVETQWRVNGNVVWKQYGF